MECARCGTGDEMLYSCPHCGRRYCGAHRYPRHGCTVPAERDSGEDEAPSQARAMDLGEPAPEAGEPATGLGEWLRRQTYPGLVVKVGLLAVLLSVSFYGGVAAVVFV